jgi:autotransporter-associated beta strand protein
MKNQINKKIRFFPILILLSAFCILPLSAFAQLEWNGTQTFNSNTTINENITLTGDVIVDVASGVTINGIISSSSNYTFTKTGEGQLTMNGNNTYAGTTIINEGRLVIGNGGTTGSVTGNIVNNGSPLVFFRSNAYTYAGVISGMGGVTIQAGTIAFSGTSTHTGDTYVSSNLILTATGFINSSKIINEGTLDISAGNKTINAINNSGEVILGSRTLTINSNNESSETSGIFSGFGGGITKTGTAVLIMLGNNTATGLFVHNEGEVLLSGVWAGNYVKATGTILTIMGSSSGILGTLSLTGGNINMNLNGAYPSKLTILGTVTASGNNLLNITTNTQISNSVLIQAGSGITSLAPYTLLPIEDFPNASLNVNSPTQLRFSSGEMIPSISTTVL